jgi:PAS domain S-box-containing protein
MQRQRPVTTGENFLALGLSEYVFRQFPAVLFTTFVLAALTVHVLWSLIPGAILLFWLGAVYAVSLLRLVLYRWHKLRSDRLTPGRWLRLYSLGAVIAGVNWGMAPLLFYSGASPQTNVFLAFVLGGLISGASSSMAPLKVTMRIFTALVCLPIATLFFIHGGSLNLVMGTMLLIYGAAYLAMSANTARMIVDSLTLRNENLREIEERKKAEAQLRLIQQGLEKTVAQRTAELRAVNEDLSREIDERLQVESRLRLSEERHRSLVESSSDWIWEVDRNWKYTYSSPSVLAILGYGQQEVLGRRFHDFMPPNDVGQTEGSLNTDKPDGKPYAGLVSSCFHKDGTERILESNGEPVFDESGELGGYRGIDRDITFRVKHDEEKRKIEHLESLGVLAGGIAHDFNNLLTAIFGNIELARIKVASDSASRRSLEKAFAAMEQARKLTGQLLTFSKGGSPILEATSVRDLILDSSRLALSGTAVKCEYDFPDDLWMADIDPRQIWHVLNNVLTNAREAMPRGGTVWISAQNVRVDEKSSIALASDNYVQVSVRDEGVGVPKNDIPRLFDPYFSTKTRGSRKGTGIGLSVCHSIIERHGGRITLDSELGLGTTVTFFLRALSVEKSRRRTRDGPEERPPGGRILMLEDDSAVIETGIGMLNHLGHEVTAVKDGAEVLELYSRSQHAARPFDLVLLDLTIRGGMGGRETLEKLREMDPDVTAIVTSGYADDPVISEFEQYGFKAALIKPFSMRTLEQTIEPLLQAVRDENRDQTAQ